jgi:hypothetical protein
MSSKKHAPDRRSMPSASAASLDAGSSDTERKRHVRACSRRENAIGLVRMGLDARPAGGLRRLQVTLPETHN